MSDLEQALADLQVASVFLACANLPGPHRKRKMVKARRQVTAAALAYADTLMHDRTAWFEIEPHVVAAIVRPKTKETKA